MTLSQNGVFCTCSFCCTSAMVFIECTAYSISCRLVLSSFRNEVFSYFVKNKHPSSSLWNIYKQVLSCFIVLQSDSDETRAKETYGIFDDDDDDLIQATNENDGNSLNQPMNNEDSNDSMPSKTLGPLDDIDGINPDIVSLTLLSKRWVPFLSTLSFNVFFEWWKIRTSYMACIFHYMDALCRLLYQKLRGCQRRGLPWYSKLHNAPTK